MQPLADLLQHGLPRLPAAAALAEGLQGVASGHLHQVLAPAPARRQDRDPFPPALGEPLVQGLPIQGKKGEEDLVGDEDLAAVELLKEGGEQLLLVQAPLQSVAAPADELSPADEQNRRLHLAALAVKSDHILVASARLDHLLPLHRLLHRPELVAKPGRLLEAHLRRGRLHLFAQQIFHLPLPP